MCRKSVLHGCCVLAFGLGLLVGHCIESWFVCICGGILLIFFGLGMMRQK